MNLQETEPLRRATHLQGLALRVLVVEPRLGVGKGAGATRQRAARGGRRETGRAYRPA